MSILEVCLLRTIREIHPKQITLHELKGCTRGSEWNFLIFQDLRLESFLTLKLSLKNLIKVCPSENLYLILGGAEIFQIVFDVIAYPWLLQG